MTQITRRVAAAGAAALALAVTTGTGGTALAAGEASNPGYVTSWVALTTGASSTVQLVTPATPPVVTKSQTLTAGKACAMTPSGDNVLTFSSTPSSPGVGIAGGSIGVREKKTSSGTSCSAVDSSAGETLILDLGSVVGTSVASSASLDIDLKQSAQIRATAILGDDEVGWFDLRSGSSITSPITLDPLPTKVQECNNPADSGPDSGVNNNCRWNISAPSWAGADDGIVFDRLELEAIKGSFSLMGGADGSYAPLPTYFGAYQNSSVFEVVEGALPCGDTVALRGSIPSSWTRLNNLDTTTDCSAYPYRTETGTEDGHQFAEFTKPLDAETTAQALWTTTFVVGGGTTVPPITMELTLPDGSTTGMFTLLPCPSDWYTDGHFDGPTSAPDDPAFACQVSAVRGSGSQKKSATYVAYVYGDAKMQF